MFRLHKHEENDPERAHLLVVAVAVVVMLLAVVVVSYGGRFDLERGSCLVGVSSMMTTAR